MQTSARNVLVKQEQYRDHLRQAENDRLARRVLARGPERTGVFGAALSAVRRWLPRRNAYPRGRRTAAILADEPITGRPVLRGVTIHQ